KAAYVYFLRAASRATSEGLTLRIVERRERKGRLVEGLADGAAWLLRRRLLAYVARPRSAMSASSESRRRGDMDRPSVGRRVGGRLSIVSGASGSSSGASGVGG